MTQPGKQWDVFISHASEDKETFVFPLASALANLGVRVWYDEFSLRVGDSLSRSIDRGLAGAAFGIVVISRAFMHKHWPEYELRGLVAREVDEDRVILPIWHQVSREDVVAFSPPLADKVALDTRGLRAEDVAIQILREVRPDIYSSHPRAELEKIASGQAIQELQAELDRTREELGSAREELAEYRCPHCGAGLEERVAAPLDDEARIWDTHEVFQCGHISIAGSVERPCPADPQFPRFEDFELQLSHTPEETHWKWACHAVGKTPMARKVSLGRAVGRTREEALQRMNDEYDRCARRIA